MYGPDQYSGLSVWFSGSKNPSWTTENGWKFPSSWNYFIIHKIVKFTLIYEASFVAICTEEDWNVPVMSIQKNVNWILELFIKFTFSCCLGTRSCATKTCLSSQHFLWLKSIECFKFCLQCVPPTSDYRVLKEGIHDILCTSFSETQNNQCVISWVITI